MALDSFPNNAHNARAVTLAENEQLWAQTPSGLIGYTGVTPAYGDSTGRQVKVRAGTTGRIRGTKFTDAAGTIVAMTTNTSGNPRIDLLVARLSRPATAGVTPSDAYTVKYVVIPGAPAAAPVAPAPVRNETTDGSGYWDIPLATINVANNYTTVAATDVTNKAWWVSPSGYQGLDAAKPTTVEPGALYQAHDTGITYIGLAGGTWQRLYYNTGWKALTAPTGYTFAAMHFARAGDVVIMNARIIRSGTVVAAGTNATFGTLSTAFRPGMSIWGVYHCTSPDHSSHVVVNTDGTIIFAADGTDTIAQNANLLSNMVWLAAA